MKHFKNSSVNTGQQCKHWTTGHGNREIHISCTLQICTEIDKFDCLSVKLDNEEKFTVR